MNAWALLDNLSSDTLPALRVEALPAVAAPVTATAVELPAQVRAKARERLEFCRAVADLMERSGRGQEESVRMVALREASRFPGLIAGGKNGASQLTIHSLRNWMRKLGRDSRGRVRWDNLDGLCDAYVRGGIQEVEDLRGAPEFWELFNSFYLHRNQLSISESYRLAAELTRRDHPLAIIPNEHQARYWVGKLDIAAVVLARHGEEALKNNFIDFIRRDWNALNSGEMLVSDHRVFDLWVRTWSPEKNNWVAVRPWICGMMDARSWLMPGWMITTENPNTNTIISTLGLAMLNNNLTPPCYLYTDQGKDFLAQGFNKPVTLDGVEHSILRELGIQDVTAIAYNARAKTIERMFGDMAKSFDKWFAAYLGNRPGDRPDAATYFGKHPEELMSLEEFTQLFAGWVEIYNRTPKNGAIHQGKSPAEIWNNRPVLRPAWSVEQLKHAMLMPIPSLRTVHRGPAISYNNKEYYSKALWKFLDKPVMVKLDRNDDEHVYAYKPDGSLICECITRDKIAALAKTDEDRAAIGDAMAEQRRQIKHCYTVISELTGKKHLVDPAQWLLSESTDTAIVKAGQTSSVKGASHTFAHYQLAEPVKALPGPELEFKEDKRLAKKLEFQEKLAATLSRGAEPASKPKIQLVDDIIPQEQKKKFILKDEF